MKTRQNSDKKKKKIDAPTISITSDIEQTNQRTQMQKQKLEKNFDWTKPPQKNINIILDYIIIKIILYLQKIWTVGNSNKAIL